MAGGNDQRYNITIGANMDPSGVLGAVKQMQGAFNGLKLPANMTGDILKNFNKLTEALSKFEKIAGQDHFSKTDVKSLQKLQKEIDSTFGSLRDSFSDLSGQKFYLEADYTKIKEARQVVSDLKAEIQSKLSDIKIDFSTAKGGTASLGLDTLLSRMEQGVKTSKTLSTAMAEISSSIRMGDLGSAGEQFNQIITKAKTLKGASAELLDTFKQWGLVDFSGPAKNIESMDERARLLGQVFEKLIPIFSQDGQAVGQLSEKLKDTVNQVTNLEKIGIERFNNSIAEGVHRTDELTAAQKNASQAAIETAEGIRRASDEVKQLQQSTQYFFSLRNMINLLKRGIREAVDTVKDLDKAMTETAVVTTYSVGDMWAKLPEYTANANALGATIQDMYESTTLYYQQGLNTQQAMEIATETMKMARIAGLEAKDATDMMTAALRGFNMELNESSATRINDVYSNLAAKTASDTKEIGTAMQRTASIAHSAGMSFEGTAAFLAQAIETTREPAENLGTAMKTIVARFTELKKNPLEITEVDGEEVSYNKVDTALQSIGVSLKDANGQFRDLDKVFLDIASKWDGLTQTQQRYIATTAAGSRQQSRFIAMMSNYERTMQLMGYANDSAGASTIQFNKTLDSLEAKINKFQNAWKEFLMGIMNDSWVKGIVDGGTKVLSTVNNIIDVLSGGGKLKGVKSILSLFTAFTVLKGGGNIINKLIGGLGGLVDPTSSFGKGFWGAGKTTSQGTPATGIAGKITTPIVAKLNELIAVTRGNKEGQIKTSSTVDQYKATNQALRKINGRDMGTIGALFGGLSDEHAYMAYKNAPGTTDAMKQATLGWLGSKKMPADAQKVGQQLMSAIFKGMDKKEISIKDGMKLLGQPRKWGQQFGTDVAWNFSNNFSKQLTNQAHENTLYSLGLDPKEYAVGSSAFKTLLKNDKALQDAYIRNFRDWRDTLEQEEAASFGNTPVIQTGFQQFANKIGSVGSAFSTAGMSLQMFGAQLGQLSPALEGVGNLLARVGMLASTFGMGISGIGGIITKVGGRFAAGKAAVTAGGFAMSQAVASGAIAAESTVAATGTSAASAFISGFTGGMSAGPIAAIIIGVLTGGIMLAKFIVDKKAREAGEEVRKNFEEGFTKTSEKITSIESYKDRFNELAAGVDKFGHNISLTDEEYDEYLSISRELQELSPSLIAGYNAEGQAIIRKGEAIDEVIKKLKEERKVALGSYINDDSVDKLIKEYKTTDTYSKHHKQADSVSYYSGTVTKGADAFKTERSDISKALKQANLEWSDFSQMLDELGIGGAKSIDDLTNRQLVLIATHYNDILNKIKEFNPQIEEKAEEGLKEAFGNTNTAIGDILSDGQPIIDSLKQWMGQEGLDAVGLELGEEFVSGFNSGLEGLMLEGLTNNWQSADYKREIKDYADAWKELAGPTTKYSGILTEADKIQREYLAHIGEDGAVKKYEDDIEDLATQLEGLAEQNKLTGAAGEAFAQQCIEQANALRTYATEGVISLKEALNTMTDEISEAEGALESFNKVAEGSNYSTAATNMQKIYEEATSDVHTAGEGDQTFWAGAEALVGRQAILDVDGDKKKVQELMNTVNKMLKGGQEGWDAFKDKWFANADANFTVLEDGSRKLLDKNGKIIEGLTLDENNGIDLIDENINPDVYKEIADALNMSENSLIAMLNLGRQFGEINFTNIDQVRKALEVSDSVIKGINKENGQQSLYIKDETLNAELASAGIVDIKQQEQKKAEMEEKGIHVIKEAGEIAVKDFQNMGVNSMESLISIFDATGQFTKNEMAEYAQKWAELNNVEWDPDKFNEKFDEHVQELEKGDTLKQLGELESLNSTAGDILSVLAKKLLTKEEQDKLNQKIGQQKAEEYYNKNGLGNTDINNRQTLNWGANPKENANFAAAKTWGWTANDLKNSISTYMSSGLTIGQGDKAVELAITPMLQTPDGTPQVLSQDVVRQYINKIAEQATDENGNINIDQLFALDKQGLEIEGQEINNLLMGAFTGEGAQEAASALGELEHKLEANKRKAADLKKEMNQGAKPQTDTGTGKAPTTPQPPLAAQHAEDHDIRYHVSVEGEEQLDNAEQKGISLEQVAAAGLNFLINTSYPGLSEALGIIQQVKDAVALKPTLQVDADTSPLTSMAAQIASIVGTYTVKIAATQSGLGGILSTLGSIWNRITNINNTKVQPAAKGKNNYIPYRTSIHAGSLAKGTKSRYGQVGPRDKGGLTLTGEEGFEIAWLPSENRSMILGATGPQMLNLPSDAVVYTHEQSKDILKQKAIPAGSHRTQGDMTRTGGSSSGKKKKKKSKKKKGKDKDKKDITPTINNFSMEEVIQYNLDQTLAKVTEQIELKTKEIEKTLERIGTTYNDIAASTQAQVSSLSQVKDYNSQLLASYQRQLADYRSQQQYVSWTDANGESQRTLINLGQFVNSEGAIDYNQIVAVAGGNRALQEALFKEVSNGTKGIVDGMQKAQKAIADADNQIAELGKKISETFYQWENELTEIYDLTQRINNETSLTDRFASQIELELAQLGAGFGDTATAISNMRKVLNRNNTTLKEQLANQEQMIHARRRELELALDFTDEVKKRQYFESKGGVDQAANVEYFTNLEEGAILGYKYVKDIFQDLDGSLQYRIDWEQFRKDNETDPYTKDTYEHIKNYLDALNDASVALNDSIKDTTDLIAQTYNALREYQDYIVNVEDTLIKGVEEEIENAKANAKQLSDSITKALKDLLDEVKRKLDERRKQEDNAKTERDISQKQQRLAALRADTAGGHQVEIAQLEKEIADSQQSYQRTLEDQLLDRLQQQADAAAQQRERQIELMETGNQIDAATNKELVDMWLRDPITYKEQIRDAWLEANGYDEKGEAGQYVLRNQFESDFAKLVNAVSETDFRNNFKNLEDSENDLVSLLTEISNGEIVNIDEFNEDKLGILQEATAANVESILTEVKKMNSAASMKEKGVDAKALKTAGYTAKDLIGEDLNNPIYSLSELQKAGYKASDITEAGIRDVGRLKEAGYTAGNLKDADFTFADLISRYTPEELKNANYNIADFDNNHVDYGTAKALFGVDALAGSNTSYAARAAKEIEDARIAAQQAQAAPVRPYGYVSSYSGSINDKTPNGSDATRAVQYALNAIIGAGLAVDGNFGSKTKAAVKAFQRAVGLTVDGRVGPDTKAAFAARGYKTGGLADYTGPAWLDGTPSKPELVLNPTDTKNFLALRDVLSSAMKSTGSVNNSYGGDTTYEININVDKLTSDYDVDRVAERVKKIIVKDSSYRNVTQVRNLR